MKNRDRETGAEAKRDRDRQAGTKIKAYKRVRLLTKSMP